MKKIESLSELNQKIWYRFLKVAFIGLIIISLFFGHIFAQSEVSNMNSNLSYCKRHIEHTPGSVTYIYFDHTIAGNYTQEDAINYFCKTELDELNKANSGLIFNYIKVGVFIFIFEEILRRIFYYIVLGNFNPKK